MRATVVLIAALVACQDNASPPPSRPKDATVAVIADAATPSDGSAEQPGPPGPPEPPDPGKRLVELGAIPAWQAVVDRAQLLARRRQHGVVYGMLGPTVMRVPAASAGSAAASGSAAVAPAATPYRWLVDDTEGNGSLGIAVKLGTHEAAPGSRVALGGAWKLDDERRWYWEVDAVHELPAGPTPDLKDPPSPLPSHDIAAGPLPAGARMITAARDHDIVYFQIVGPSPLTDGDGWLVANELGDTPFARLTLPGERASYGAQDMRAPDERWQLRRGQTYWIRIGKIRKYSKPDDPVGMHGRTAPVRLN